MRSMDGRRAAIATTRATYDDGMGTAARWTMCPVIVYSLVRSTAAGEVTATKPWRCVCAPPPRTLFCFSAQLIHADTATVSSHFRAAHILNPCANAARGRRSDRPSPTSFQRSRAEGTKECICALLPLRTTSQAINFTLPYARAAPDRKVPRRGLNVVDGIRYAGLVLCSAQPRRGERDISSDRIDLG